MSPSSRAPGPLRLALVLGINHSAAMTYAELARQILAADHEPSGRSDAGPSENRRFVTNALQPG